MDSLNYQLVLTPNSKDLLKTIIGLCSQRNSRDSSGRKDLKAIKFWDICNEADLTTPSLEYYMRHYLYGLVSVVVEEFSCWPVGKRVNCIKYYGVYIPEVLEKDLASFVDSSGLLFERKISEKSLPILEFIYNSTLKCKTDFGGQRQYFFHPSYLAKNLGLNIENVSTCLEDLTGIIMNGICLMNGWAKDPLNRDKTKQAKQYRQRIFLPRSRERISENLLGS